MKFTIKIVAFLLLVSCQSKSGKKYEQLEKINWLIGNDSTFSAKSYFIKEEDTLHNETILLTQKNDIITYSAKIVGENNDKSIDFKLTSITENNCVFENPSHDYPQKIIYKKTSNNSLIATVSGIQQGKQSTENYSMNKN